MESRISDSEKRFILEGINQDVRVDGRGRLDYRYLTVECGLLPQANGSARISLINGNTDVVAAVKAELAEPVAGFPDRGRVECSVDCWSSASPSFEGRGAQDINAELSHTLSSILATSGALDLASLCVIPGKQCWVLYVDVLVLDSGGSLVDTVTLAAYAALANARLPKLHVVSVGTKDGGGEELDIEVDEDPNAAVAIDASGVPITVTFCQIGGRSVVDARVTEELCATSRVMVSVNRASKVCAVQTSGKGSISPAALHASIESGCRIAGMLIGLVDGAIAAEQGNASKGKSGSSSAGSSGGGSGGGGGASGGAGGGAGAAELSDEDMDDEEEEAEEVEAPTGFMR